jgi:hypothetical protein
MSITAVLALTLAQRRALRGVRKPA